MSEIIKFQGDAIEVVREGEDVWVSVRRVCEGLGVSFSPQRRKLLSDEAMSVIILNTGRGDGVEPGMLAINLESLPLWLASINAGKVRPELRQKLLAYKRECARVLRDHFFGRPAPAATPVQPPALAAIAGCLRDSPMLRDDVRRWMWAASKCHAVHFGRVTGWIAREFSVASYLRLPLPLAVYARERLVRIVSGGEAPPFNRKQGRSSKNPNQLSLVP